MKLVLKLFAGVGFAAVAAVVGQVAWNMASPDGAGLGWPAVIFAAIGALAGWYRVK
jgi:hypothetical protein